MTPVQLSTILERHGNSDANLLGILQDIQEEENWLPRETLESVAERLKLPFTRIYRLATFFKSLSLEPRGKHICTVCIGTTCHVRGAPRLVDKVRGAEAGGQGGAGHGRQGGQDHRGHALHDGDGGLRGRVRAGSAGGAGQGVPRQPDRGGPGQAPEEDQEGSSRGQGVDTCRFPSRRARI
ncbi:MAG: NAD(P)H-dependent oxidoreductase subunit E [Deltaproteobacteria bacterium]|nr:NAD(P)H-dependent oxidoreductase subunit E [Deltaproteobacteria bacterium]